MGSRHPRIQEKQKPISVITFEKWKSKQIGYSDLRFQEKQRQDGVKNFTKQ